MGWELWASPRFYGLERLPAEPPLLFVGNHTLMAAYDVPFLALLVWDRYGKFVRGLSDHLHFRVPLWRDFMTYFGAVAGTRQTCGRLMQQGEVLLTFPGGGREVAKGRGEQYQLHWRDRVGFARAAVEHGCTIVPFSMVGADDAWDIAVGADQLLDSAVGPLLKRLGLDRERMMPVVFGLGPTIVPRPDRLYFHFSEPVSTDHLRGRQAEDDFVFEVRDQVREAVEEGIRFLQAERARDPGRTLPGRIRTGEWLDLRFTV